MELILEEDLKKNKKITGIANIALRTITNKKNSRSPPNKEKTPNK